ncbi:antitoxin [Auraticoccus sp. F435]|uniref:Antitoxin n=1 Tax=Auraticoccus cholistanensis TaxID=2656650 RepID=A0A6A9V0I5_9ACTN|nr:antitoxin [Auraticoccus cholistanensis]MVA75669.1 antitoxin [Auraticoccus cholistanensis]
MGIFDKAKDLAAQHSDKLRSGVDKVGDVVDQRTGGRHADKVDKGQAAVDRLIERNERRGGTTPPPPAPPA